jgi:branched-subunit amino acid transport protein AzlD
MILSSFESIIIIAVIALGTLLTRALPFILFPDSKKVPEYVAYLGHVLPYAAIALLIVYCLKGVAIFKWPYGLPEGIAIMFIAVLHYWKNNSLLSIGGGTILYMLMVQHVFG